MRPRKTDKHLPPCIQYKHGAYYLTKKAKWLPLGKDLSTALTEYARIMAEPKGGMCDLIDSALPSVLKGRAKATQEQYKTASRKLKTILRDFTPQQVKSKHIAQIKRAKSDSPNATNRMLSVLRMIFEYALDEQIVDSNPVTGIKRLEEKKRGRLISEEEFSAIYSKAPPRLQIVMDLLALTGQRVNDVLKIRHVDLKDEGIYFQQDKTEAKLIVKWTPELRSVVKRANDLGGNVKAFTLLYGRGGKPLDYYSIRDQWRTATRAANVPDATMRDLRAMSATAAKSQGKNATRLLGHTSEGMTQRYLRDKEIPLVEGPSFRRLKDGQA